MSEHRWTAEGLVARLPVRGPLPFLGGTRLPVLLGGLVVAVFLLSRAEGPVVPPPLPELPAGCEEAPWSCPVAPDGTAADPGFDNGLQPEALERLVRSIAHGSQSLGATSDATVCRDIFRGIAPAMPGMNVRCTGLVKTGLASGDLEVPASMPPATPFAGPAGRLRESWEQQLRSGFASARADAIDERERVRARKQLAVERHRTGNRAGMAFLGVLWLLGIGLAVWRTRAGQPLELQIGPKGVRIGSRTFPRNEVSAVRVAETLRIRLVDGSTWESRPLALADDGELQAALDQVLLGDRALEAEGVARSEVEQALDPLRSAPRNPPRR